MKIFMTNVKTGAVVVTAALLAFVLAPSAFADTTVKVADNGAGSKNIVHVENEDKTSVDQSNVNVVANYVHSSADTGDNSVSYNTGKQAENSISTGEAKSSVEITNEGPSNKADVKLCGCKDDDTKVKITDNGKHSLNIVKVENEHKTKVEQSNFNAVLNKVYSKADTGDNKVKGNTGGSNTIETSDAKSKVSIVNEGPKNWLGSKGRKH